VYVHEFNFDREYTIETLKELNIVFYILVFNGISMYVCSKFLNLNTISTHKQGTYNVLRCYV